MLSDQPARRQQRAGAGLSVWNPRLRAKPCSLPHAVLPQILAGLPVLMAPIRGPCSRGQSVGFDMRTAPPPPAHRAAPSLFRPVGAHCSLTHRDHEPSSCPQPSALSRRSYELSHCARSPPPPPSPSFSRSATDTPDAPTLSTDQALTPFQAAESSASQSAHPAPC